MVKNDRQTETRNSAAQRRNGEDIRGSKEIKTKERKRALSTIIPLKCTNHPS
jgi:hypothetical protein